MLTRVGIALGLLLFPLLASAASPVLRIEREPAWVRPLPLADSASVQSDRADGGVYVLLHDVQFNRVSQPVEDYFRTAMMVVNEAGVPTASQISCEFDPADQQLIFHRVVIHRHGRTIDKLVLSRFKMLQRETSLESSLYLGTWTAVLLLDDVRAGDIVDCSYTLRGGHPDLAGHFGVTWRLGWDTSLQTNHHRLLWPAGRPLSIRPLNSVVEPSIAHGPGTVEYTWTVENAPRVEPEEDLPPWYNPYPAVQLSDFGSWSEVAKWGVNVFKTTTSLSEPMRERIAAIQDSSAVAEQRVLTAIRFVQDEIRYFGIELGRSSYRPTPPERVLAQRFGDCKDKSLLLITLLRGLGVEAYPAFVNSEKRGAVRDLLPSPFDFDHVVVWFRFAGATHWVDATEQAERGSTLDALDVPDFGYALPLADTTTQLVPMSAPPGARGRTVIRKDFDASHLDAPAQLGVRITYEGRDANAARLALRKENGDAQMKRHQQIYAGLYPGIQLAAPFSVTDDEKTNRIMTYEAYQVPAFWSRAAPQGAPVAQFDALEMMGKLPPLETSLRTMPLSLGEPHHFICETHATMPKGWSAPRESVSFGRGPVKFQLVVSARGQKLDIRQDYEISEDFVPAAEARSTVHDLHAIESALGYETKAGINLSRTRDASGVNWLGVLVCAIAALLGVAVALWFPSQSFAKLRPKEIPSMEPLAESASFVEEQAALAHATTEGLDPLDVERLPAPLSIGGWLILMAVGVTLSPVWRFIASLKVFRLLGEARWLQMERFARSGSHPGFMALLLFEVAADSILLVWAAALTILFYRRHRAFPHAWIAVGLCNILYVGLDHVGVKIANSSQPSSDFMAVGEILMGALAVGTWGSYLLASRRVDQTFVRSA
jgi:Domain of Unknown Function with PDB structure (DUF3857)/Protein of unknown function (DUF2569)